ncbi:vacuolar sorting protein VPS33/slp1 [Scheffersomyces spartinae]|uniref:Vacuolar sorting protein VPS33/slp1 n=1 Tax=Scheffersomyces spartinae TaxID=45513 RepID=A0A9P7V5R3_9ASCO|nr:vacuolar sorting protein VPS33/slp1 [Scheffersomyces spartinae]KAG7191654.1 vacuolar sorting protein VPS33/slp1 [Scheffersomyces spartinae]
MVKNIDPLSLINIQREYLFERIRQVQEQGKLYVLVVDRKIKTLIDAIISKDQLLRLVVAVELIDERRKPQSYLEAIYMCHMSVYNLQCILSDVHTNRYRLGHGLLIPKLGSDMELNHFYNQNFLTEPKIVQYFQNQKLIEYINASMFPLESRCFVVDSSRANAMPIYYNENLAELVPHQIKRVAEALVNVVVVTGEYPYVRYQSSSKVAHLIAQEFQSQLDNYARLNIDYPPPQTNRVRSVLLITDRSLDLFAPLLHEFTYQAMAMDIVESLEKEGVYKFNSENELGEISEVNTEIDNEDDEEWVMLRHCHIVEASELIISKINDLIKNNPMLVDRTKAKTSSDLLFIVAHLKGFDEERKHVSLHKLLIDECVQRNDERKLAEFAADFEQTCCADGITFENERNKHLHDDLIELLARQDLLINDKIRLVLIYGLYRGGLIEDDFTKLAMFIGVDNKQVELLVSRCFVNFAKLGFPLIKSSPKDKNSDKKLYHSINNEGTFNTSRFIGGLKNVLQQVTTGTLSEEEFPYIRERPLEDELPKTEAQTSTSTTSGPQAFRTSRVRATWADLSNTKSSTRKTTSRQRIYSYVAGGMTYSELRAAYELSKELDKEVYIGSETLLRPRDFCIGLQDVDINKSVDRINLPLLQELRGPRDAPGYMFEVPKPPAPPQSSSNPNPALNQQYNRLSQGSSISSKPMTPNLSSKASMHSLSPSGGDKSSPSKKKKSKFKIFSK